MNGPNLPARKAVFAITGLERGGAEIQIVRVASGLRKRGWTVQVISLLPLTDLADALEREGVPVAWAGLRRGRLNLPGIVRFAMLLRRARPDVAVAFLFHANVLTRVCGRLARIPVIVSSIRNVRVQSVWRAWVERATSRFDSATTTNSWTVGDVLQRRGIAGSRLRVIPNGLSLDEFRELPGLRESVRREAGLDGSHFLWLAVGSLSAQKDHSNLLKAFDVVARQAPEARLWISGDGPLRQRLEREIAQLGLAKCVSLLGLRDDVPRLLSAADAAALSSAWEGLPNVVMEALAAGRPVVATHVGGVPDLIRHAVSGVLVPPGDPGALAEAMLAVMRMHPGERRQMGTAGRAVVEARCRLDVVLDAWEAMLNRLIEESAVQVPALSSRSVD